MMKPSFLILFLSGLIFFGVAISANAQNNTQFKEDETVSAPQNYENILQELGLTNAQLEQIRNINRQYRPPVREANRSLRAANQALDDAVYSGQSDEAVILTRLKAAQMAHAEWIKNRTKLEREITKVLNPEQLSRFREFRLQKKQINLRNRQLKNQAQPSPQRLNRIQRQIRRQRNQRRNNL